MSIALGIDFGGTKVLAGVVNLNTGEVLATAKRKTDAQDSADQMMSRLHDVVESATEKAGIAVKELSGIGVGLAGQVDTHRGILRGAPNLSQSTVDLPMADLLTKRFKIPAKLRNDVQVAAIGEAAFGAGRDQPDFVCIFVGTGIGGAIVRGGRLVTGAAGAAGEIGHIVIHANGRICGCGGRGHLEAYASRTAMTQALLGEMKRGRPSMLIDAVNDSDDSPGGTAIRSGQLAAAVDAGDELERFNPDAQKDRKNPWSYLNFAKHFPPQRVLSVVGTNYRSYGTRSAALLNRLSSSPHEFGWNYNRSDGLVKQASAQLPDSPRADEIG